jgi:hypothetical protein
MQYHYQRKQLDRSGYPLWILLAAPERIWGRASLPLNHSSFIELFNMERDSMFPDATPYLTNALARHREQRPLTSGLGKAQQTGAISLG